MKKTHNYIFFFVIVCVLGGLYVYDVRGASYVRESIQNIVAQGKYIQEEHKKNIEKEEVDTSVSLLFVGDTMMDRGVESSVQRNFGGDFQKLFIHVQEYFNASDIVFLNLEGPISDKGKNVGSKYSFRMDPIVADVLGDVGVDIVSFANNHVGDWSVSAFSDTLLRLESAGVLFTGAGRNDADAITPRIIERNGITFAFLGFSDVGPDWLRASENSPGQLLARDTRLVSLIQQAKEQSDIVIVSFHFGDEYVTASNRQKTLARSAIDAGATFVIGHHPHVIQEIEEYNGGLIVYSLGNFIFDQYFSENTMRGMMLSVEMQDKDTWSYHPRVVELDRTYQPIRVRDLVETDMIKSKISIPDLCPRTPQGHVRNILIPVSHTQSLGSYAPPKLIHMNNRVDTRGTATCLDEEAGLAFEKLVNDALKEGLKIIMASGYRDANTQADLYKSSEPSFGEFPSVAKSGHSEHQLGTVVDLKSGSTDALSYDSFVYSPEYVWMQKNAHKYGFVQSFKQGEEDITGYISEPWHWRYVGVSIASLIQESELPVVTFLDNLEKESTDENL
ncbi:MAG: CapA family protein [Candidatus Pacebacteria bacterium]|nr:CapA family protein [Candidatus Paceibacterota bacterium]